MKTHLFRFVAVALSCVPFLAGQPVDDTELKQVIIFSRHSVRAPVAPNSYLDSYSVRPFPAFGVAPGILTDNGARLETILGGYYRLWLTKEGEYPTRQDWKCEPSTIVRLAAIRTCE